MHVFCCCLFFNNNNGHFYGAWSLARSRAQCAVQKAAEKCINTYNGQDIKNKSFGLYVRQPCKNLHTGISVNKLKLPVTKHDQTLILAHMYDTSRYTANTKMYSGILHTHILTYMSVCATYTTEKRKTQTKITETILGGQWILMYLFRSSRQKSPL